MRWPWHLRREHYETVRALTAELERERQQHHDDVFTLITGTGVKAIQFGNVARVWPEQLDQFRELAREGAHQVFVVSGAGKCHGVYWVWP
jgi:hypothetical protein